MQLKLSKQAKIDWVYIKSPNRLKDTETVDFKCDLCEKNFSVLLIENQEISYWKNKRHSKV